MKCQHCHKEIKGNVAYYLGMKVHPECFDELKYEDTHSPKSSWLNEIIDKLPKKTKKTPQN